MEEKLKRSSLHIDYSDDEISLRIYVTSSALKRVLIAVLLLASAILGVNVEQIIGIIRGFYGY